MNTNWDLQRVITCIEFNDKRMEKIRTLPDALAKRKKAKGFVVAECAKLKIKLNEHDIIRAAAVIAGDA